MDERPREHATVGLARWVGFLAFSALVLGGVAYLLIAIWRWLF